VDGQDGDKICPRAALYCNIYGHHDKSNKRACYNTTLCSMCITL